MYQIAYGATHNLPDVAEFIELLNSLERCPVADARRLFDPKVELTLARAPGRLDVMGGIADYSGSLVLELPIREATLVALQRDPSRKLTVVSLPQSPTRTATFEMHLADFEHAGRALDYESARSRFQLDPAGRWAAYVAGVFLVLMRERGVRFEEGARILITSSVPEGKGVSSSAALEVAVMQAATTAFEIGLEPRAMAMLCQTVENQVVGAPCGVMDQSTAACGEANQLLALLCQPAEIREMIAIPREIEFWGLDSGVRHDVSGPDYSSVRVGTFMGYRIIAHLAGLNVGKTRPEGHVHVDDPYWHGYLANLDPSEFEQRYSLNLPEHITGSDFLSLYQGTTDPLTLVDSDRVYAVRAPTAHAIYEHHRVRLFAELMAGLPSERRLELLGELMYQSHASYSACGLGSAGTDRLVQLVRQAGRRHGLYGAKITGGGSGGTVAVVGRHEAGEFVASLAERYERETGHRPLVFAGSSPGSAAFGHLKLRAS